MRRRCIALVAAGSVALLASGPADASIFKKIGHAIGKSEKAIGHVTMNGVRGIEKESKKVVKFVNKEAATPVGKAVLKYTGKGLDYGGTTLDHLGNTLQNTPIVGAAAPLMHDASKALHSKTAHYAAAIGAGLAIGGGTLGPMAGVGTSSTAGGRVLFAAGQGGMTGYYGRQAYLGVRCMKGHTKTCDRLQSKP